MGADVGRPRGGREDRTRTTTEIARDVAVLRAWEKQLSTLLAELRDLEEAVERLRVDAYPGTGFLSDALGNTFDPHQEGSLAALRQELALTLEGGGDLGRYLHNRFHGRKD